MYLILYTRMMWCLFRWINIVWNREKNYSHWVTTAAIDKLALKANNEFEAKSISPRRRLSFGTPLQQCRWLLWMKTTVKYYVFSGIWLKGHCVVGCWLFRIRQKWNPHVANPVESAHFIIIVCSQPLFWHMTWFVGEAYSWVCRK